ncbi:MAG: superoxide dismutase family protein [Flavobacterium sp.]|nr:superoxide dismutase family protein [Flavobacterium sp.]
MRLPVIVLSAATLLLTACKTNTNPEPEKKLNLAFDSKSGSNVKGTATFSELKGEVTFTAEFSGLTPGVHAIHIHEKGDCSSEDASSAGGHWNPTFESHGKWGSASYHKGDIGNFTTDQYGNGTVTMSTDEWCIGCGDPKKDILGKSVIVHTKADDYVTQPTGDAGGRIACTAIIR